MGQIARFGQLDKFLSKHWLALAGEPRVG